jgi:hypothetical protein
MMTEQSPTVPIEVLYAAECLVAAGDPARFKAWLRRYTREERNVIRAYLNALPKD